MQEKQQRHNKVLAIYLFIVVHKIHARRKPNTGVPAGCSEISGQSF